jgi:hypothetical protein
MQCIRHCFGMIAAARGTPRVDRALDRVDIAAEVGHADDEAIAVVLVFNGSNADIAATLGQACRDGLERQLHALNRRRHRSGGVGANDKVVNIVVGLGIGICFSCSCHCCCFVVVVVFALRIREKKKKKKGRTVFAQTHN